MSVQDTNEARTMGMIATVVVAAIAMVLAGGALVIAVSGGGPAGTDAAAGLDVAAPADAPSSVEVELSEFAISPGDLEVAAGGTLEITNAGADEHDLAVVDHDLGTPMLGAGESASLSLEGLEPGTYELLCTVPGHDSAGMTGTLTVHGAGDEVVTAEPAVDDDAADDDAADDDHGDVEVGDTEDWDALDAAMAETIAEFPAETDGLGNQPLEPEEIRDDGTKVFRLVAETFDWELEPGNMVEAWGYNGQVPGPMIQVDVGDDVEVIVENELPMGTDVHWHGVRVPNDQDGVAPITQDLIESGDTFTYEFTAEEPAIGMYHPHHHGQMKLPNGMFGVFIIGETGEDFPLPAGDIGGREVPEDIEIAQEIPMVLNDAGAIGLSLNGKSFPATEPIVVEEDEWIVIHYYNEGLQIHPMHLHQMPQLVFAKDGFPLDAPQWEDTVNVAPGERYSVLVHASDPGVWVLHCHILTHAERHEGMFGMVTAMIVEET
jgi:manganese oxidase